MAHPGGRYYLKAFLILSGFLVLAPQHLWAQQQPPATCINWTNIQKWNGTITWSGSGQSTDPDGSTANVSENATLTFTLTGSQGSSNPCDPLTLSRTTFTWSALGSAVTYSVNMHDVFTTPSADGNNNPCIATTTLDVGNGTAGALGSAVLGLNFSNQTNGVYSIGWGQSVNGVTVAHSGCGVSDSSTSALPSGPSVSCPSQPGNGAALCSFPLPATVSGLTGSTTFQARSAAVPLTTALGITWTVTWNIAPAPPDVDVIVTIPDYPTWRPTAGRSETELAGIALIIQAQLVFKSTTQVASGIIPDKWSLSLVNFSNEPGVAMNWPSMKDRANPSPPDMTFDKQINLAINPSLTISNNDTLAEIVNPSQTSSPQSVAVILIPFDWGGWATLNVTATVNGLPILGHFQGDSTTDILLPKRQPGSHIADVWKTSHNVPLSIPDDDDSETDPAGLPGCIGDGLTLFEEYRGFMENGKHIEGDPHNKDFFIQNKIGADAEPGIWLFTDLTGLTVHKDIQPNEMDGVRSDGTLGDRLINFNHTQGAHATDQHGVIIATCAPQLGFTSEFRDGGKTFLTTAGVRGRPGLTTGICMQGRDRPGTFLNPDNTHHGVISVTDALLQYDVGVAHELLHSVGVEHHGDGDQGEVFHFLTPDDPKNTTGQPVFQLNGQNVRLLPEQGGPDRATIWWQNIQASIARCQNIVANPSQFPPVFVEVCQMLLSEKTATDQLEGLYVGRPKREHSGNDLCVMRYFFAQAYPSATDSSVYYLVTAGTEPVGSSLDDSPAGTGVNGPNHPPQPRYFDAAPARGACKEWVCVSDKYAPVPK